MSQWLTNLPLFRRLFLAFFLAAVIPDIVILIMSNSYRQVLDACQVTCTVSPAQTGPLLTGTFIALIITTSTVIVLGFLVNLTVTQRLRHVAAFTKRIGKGETNERARVTGRDEI